MKKNDIVEIEITALSSECSGIGKKDGMVIFVPFSAIGDKLEVKILKVNKTYCYGKIERIITPSPDRVTPTAPFTQSAADVLCGILATRLSSEPKSSS